MASTPSIQFGGLVSGLDTSSIIEQLMEVERQPLNRLEERINYLTWKKEALLEVNNSLLSLYNSVSDLTFSITFTSRTVETTDEDVVTGRATNYASPGSYEIEVLQLAYGERLSGSVFSDTSAPIGTGSGLGSYTFYVNGVSITVSDAYTLDEVKEAINSVSDQTNVRAYILGGRLILESTETGSSATIALTDSADLSGGTDPSEVLESLGILTDTKEKANVLQQAQDALFEVNGVSITSSTNTVENELEEVTLYLQGVGTARITVGYDVDRAVEAMNNFVNQYNETIDLLNRYLSEEVVIDPQTEEEQRQGILREETSLRLLFYRLRDEITRRVPGIEGLEIASQVGLSTGAWTIGEEAIEQAKTGHLEFDEEVFREAMESDPLKVYRLFAAEGQYIESESLTEYKVGSPIGLWHFDERLGNASYDYSGNGLDAQVVGATRVLDGGNYALSFNGVSDYVSIASNSLLDMTDSVTLEAWIKPASIGGLQTILAKGDDTGTNYGLRLNGSEIEFFYTDSGGAEHIYRTSLASIASGNWYHVGVTFSFGEGDSINIVVNNSSVSGSWVVGDGSGLAQVNSSSLTIGLANNYSDKNPFNGIIDEVAIYGSALNSSQIAERYSASRRTVYYLSSTPVSMEQPPVLKVNGTSYTLVAGIPESGEFSLDYTTGKILLGNAPALGASVSASYVGDAENEDYWGIARRLKEILYDYTRWGGIILSTAGTGGTIDQQLNRLEKEKADLEARLAEKESFLWNKFVALEEALSNLQSQSNWLTAYLANLAGS
ncbi:MAG: flagellar filament capping protein FliD [Synergistetes bacterium]|nr:flagellar filament capping protein FliD [Synergistota bacterium]